MTKLQELLKKLSVEKIAIICADSSSINSTERLKHLNLAIKAIRENRVILPANDCAANNIFLECVLGEGKNIQRGKHKRTHYLILETENIKSDIENRFGD